MPPASPAKQRRGCVTSRAYPESERPSSSDQGHEVVLRVLRAIGLVEELRLDRFSMELERLDLGITALDPLELHGDDVLAPQWQWSRHSWLVGLGRRGALRVEPLEPPPIPSVEKIADPSGLTSGEALLNGASAHAVGPDWPWQAAGASTRAERPIGGLVRFVKVRRLVQSVTPYNLPCWSGWMRRVTRCCCCTVWSRWQGDPAQSGVLRRSRGRADRLRPPFDWTATTTHRQSRPGSDRSAGDGFASCAGSWRAQSSDGNCSGCTERSAATACACAACRAVGGGL